MRENIFGGSTALSKLKKSVKLTGTRLRNKQLFLLLYCFRLDLFQCVQQLRYIGFRFFNVLLPEIQKYKPYGFSDLFLQLLDEDVRKTENLFHEIAHTYIWVVMFHKF